MDPLSWTGPFGAYFTPALAATAGIFAIFLVARIVLSFFAAPVTLQSNSDGTLHARGGALGLLEMLSAWLLWLLVALICAFVVAGVLMPYGSTGILGAMAKRFLPVWLALIATFIVSIRFKRKLGLYGKLFDSTVGMIGFGIVMFWAYTAFFAGAFNMIATHDPLVQISGLKNKLPGVVVPTEGVFPHYLLGGDNLARDVFSRMVKGSAVVISIAPLATLFAFMVGITLGLPAGYRGGRLDTILSFASNLILAFPVILLFYLLVTPEIVSTGIPSYLATVLFLFPIIFLVVLINSRYHTQPRVRNIVLFLILLVCGWLYLSLLSDPTNPIEWAWVAKLFFHPTLSDQAVEVAAGSGVFYPYRILPSWLDLFNIPGGILTVFVSVVFVNSPTVFRIVRGLTMDIKTRDYVAAAQTRGEGPWYIMLWEILPNARGPLIVDFCLRIGYTTILLGTLGFFGLGLSSESADWGSTINEARKLMQVYIHPVLPPALALLSLVLGLNLLADGLREESLRD